MKAKVLSFSLALMAACSSPPQGTDTSQVANGSMPSSVSEAKAGSPAPNYVSASGVVQTVDAAAKTITIAHGAIPAVKWPAMTMTFTAPAIDLTRIKTGDRLDFELVVSGMHGEVTKIAHR